MPLKCFVWHAAPLEQHAFPSQQFVPHASGCADGQPQVPPEQTCAPGHTCPQVPQFELSVAVVVHVLAQHAWPAPQAMPHVPQ
jgi:hypothetical protein